MKKLINDVHQVVADSLHGFAAAHQDLVQVHFDPDYVVRKTPKEQGKVGIISGGGSGHEPLHAGFVGFGMLDAAVPGAVFTSPTPDPIQAATKAADRGAGVLHIVKNYTGDVLNFETAAEFCEADGIEVTQVVINDDVAVEDSLYTAGRRGVAGTMLVEKVAGAAAEAGKSLSEVTEIAQKMNDSMASMGLALSAGTVPHAGKPGFDLADDEVEIGIGIHGEPGRRRVPLAPARELTDLLLDPILDELKLANGTDVCLLVNGMGGTPLSELYIVFGHASDRLAKAGLQLTRCLVGNYVTSLEMAGCSVTVASLDEQMLELFDAPVHTAAWRKGI